MSRLNSKRDFGSPTYTGMVAAAARSPQLREGMLIDRLYLVTADLSRSFRPAPLKRVLAVEMNARDLP